MKSGDECILVVGDKRHMGSVIGSLPSKPTFEHGVQVSESMAAVTVAVDGPVPLTGGNDDQVLELDGTKHAIVISRSDTDAAGRTVVLAYLKPEAEIPTAPR